MFGSCEWEGADIERAGSHRCSCSRLYSVVTAFPAQGYLFSVGGFSVGERCCCTVAACRDPIKMLRSSFVHEYLLLPSVLCCPNKLLLLWVAACRDRTTTTVSTFPCKEFISGGCGGGVRSRHAATRNCLIKKGAQITCAPSE